jgi:hypothetical protein
VQAYQGPDAFAIVFVQDRSKFETQELKRLIDLHNERVEEREIVDDVDRIIYA